MKTNLKVDITDIRFYKSDGIDVIIYTKDFDIELSITQFKKMLRVNKIDFSSIPNAFKSLASFSVSYRSLKSVQKLAYDLIKTEEDLEKFEILKKCKILLCLEDKLGFNIDLTATFIEKKIVPLCNTTLNIRYLIRIFSLFKRYSQYYKDRDPIDDQLMIDTIEEFLSFFDDTIKLAGECL